MSRVNVAMLPIFHAKADLSSLLQECARLGGRLM